MIGFVGSRSISEKDRQLTRDLVSEAIAHRYGIVSVAEDLRALSKEFNARVHGRGGGQKEMIQGSLRADPEEVRLAAEQLFGPVYA